MERLSDIVLRRVSPGVLIFDLEGRLLYSNREALDMMTVIAGDDPPGADAPPPLPAEIAALRDAALRHAPPAGAEAAAPMPHAVLSRPPGLLFSLRTFLVGDHGDGGKPPHLMMLMEKIVAKHEADFARAERDFDLSKREVDVLKGICQGKSNREISDQLFISEETVKGHIKKIMQKMDVGSRSEIIVALR